VALLPGQQARVADTCAAAFATAATLPSLLARPPAARPLAAQAHMQPLQWFSDQQMTPMRSLAPL
jgi:hypothetical protein